MQYLYIIEPTKRNLSASVPDLPGVGATDQTHEGLRERLTEAVALHVHAMQADGESVPEPLTHADDLELVDGEEVAYVQVRPVSPVSVLLREAVARAGVTQEELAQRLGKSQPAVARQLGLFYHGHTFTTIQEFAEALGQGVRVKLEPLKAA